MLGLVLREGQVTVSKKMNCEVVPIELEQEVKVADPTREDPAQNCCKFVILQS